jgi:ribose transport system substrate-binding protein
MMRTRVNRTALAALVAGAGLLLGACGAGSAAPGDTIAVDVGTGKPVQLPKANLKIGIFMNSLSNQWQQNLADSAKAKAESFGWNATVTEFNFDQQAMQNALQSAITTHRYDAIAVSPIDGQQSCRILSETAPKSNVLVTVGGVTICGRDLKTGNDMWAPGTLDYCTVAPSYDYAKLWLQKSAELFAGPQKVAVVVGPEQNGNTILMHDLAKTFARSNPQFEIRDFINTDFTTPTTVTTVQNYLQAHKDTTALLSVYSPDISRGVIQALQASGMSGKVKVADMGGSQYSADEIKSGAISLTMPYYPKSIGANMIQSIKDAQEGKAPQRVVDEIPGGIKNPTVVTAANVASYTAQF